MGRPALLYLAHRFPYPPDRGDRIRTFHLVKHLAQYSDIHLACLADEPATQEAVNGLREQCKRLAVVPISRMGRRLRGVAGFLCGHTATDGAFHSAGLRTIVREWLDEVDFAAALGSASSMIPYLRDADAEHIPVVVDLVDVDSQKWFDYAAQSRGPAAWFYHTEGKRLRRIEKTLPKWARAITLVSEAEADVYRVFCNSPSVHGITNGVDTDYFSPDAVHGPERGARAENSCVFVGVLSYRPNVDGLVWFCHEVWPEVQRQRPGTKLYLVGKNPSKAVRRLAQLPGVELVGPVPDVRPYLSQATLAIVPLTIARGVQNKILEALAMEKPTIVSPEALTGLQARPGIDLLKAASAKEWVESIIALCDSPELRHRLGAAGRRYVEEHHSWDRCLAPFGRLLGFHEGKNGAVNSSSR